MAKKKKRPLTAWQKHVKSYMAENPGITFKEALPKAKLTYGQPKKKKNPKKRSKSVAKKKNTKKKRSFTLPLAPIAGIIVAMAEPVQWAVAGDYVKASELAFANLTGYEVKGKTWNESKWSLFRFKKGLLPIIIGLLVHKFVGGWPLNLNRMLGNANVPLLRV